MKGTKKTNLLYWIFTIVFVALMAFSAIPNFLKTADAVKFLHDYLEYPTYFIPFVGAAKLLGVITILIPGFRRLKEWAYAGLFFDLAGAVYSMIAVSEKFDPSMLFILIWIIPGILSYFYWQKSLNYNKKP